MSKTINTLYKYTKSEYLSKCLKFGVYASRLDDLNDPYEKKGIEDVDKYRVACMTKSYKKMLMWSYYTNHKGICIAYKIDDVSRNYIKKVKYNYKLANRRYLTVGEIKEDLLKKGKDWKHELEYRAVYFSDDKDGMWKRDGKINIYLKLPVRKIIVGCETSEHDLSETIKTVKEFNQKNGTNIIVSRLIMSDDKHELVEDKQFDFITWKPRK